MSIQYRITADYDQVTERPDTYGIGRMVSFNNGHTNFQHPDHLDGEEILATLSYYEHGACRWMVGDSTVPDYGRFDTVSVAGVIVWNGNDDDRPWWDEQTPDQKQVLLEGIAESFTDWANGNCYAYTIDRIDHCMDCGHEIVEHLDSCGGYVGEEWFLDSIKDTLLYHRIPINDKVEFAGEAEYALEGLRS